jgi:hypothetical protein
MEAEYKWGFLLENSIFTPFDNHNTDYIEREWQAKGAHFGHKIDITDSHLSSPAVIYFGIAQNHLRMPGTRYYVIRANCKKQDTRSQQLQQDDRRQCQQEQQFKQQQHQTHKSLQQQQQLDIEHDVSKFQRHYLNLMALCSSTDFNMNEDGRSIASLAFLLWHQDTFSQCQVPANMNDWYENHRKTE